MRESFYHFSAAVHQRVAVDVIFLAILTLENRVTSDGRTISTSENSWIQ